MNFLGNLLRLEIYRVETLAPPRLQTMCSVTDQRERSLPIDYDTVLLSVSGLTFSNARGP